MNIPASFLARADLRHGDLVPVVDVERAGNCKADPEPAALWREVKAFQDAVEEEIGARPIIYTTWWFHVRMMGPEYRGERFWIRNLLGKPGKAIPWVFWQKDVRAMRGVQGDIDENEFHAGRDGLTEFIMAAPLKAQKPVSSM